MSRGVHIGVCPECGRTVHVMPTHGTCERCWRRWRWNNDEAYRLRQLELQADYKRRKQ